MIEGRGREWKEKSGSGHLGGHGLVLPSCPQPHLRVLLDLEPTEPQKKALPFPELWTHISSSLTQLPLSVSQEAGAGASSYIQGRAQCGYRQGIGSEFADHLDGNGLPFPQPEHRVFETRWRQPRPLLWLEGLYL